jgi:hypothetical protein
MSDAKPTNSLTVIEKARETIEAEKETLKFEFLTLLEGAKDKLNLLLSPKVGFTLEEIMGDPKVAGVVQEMKIISITIQKGGAGKTTTANKRGPKPGKKAAGKKTRAPRASFTPEEVLAALKKGPKSVGELMKLFKTTNITVNAKLKKIKDKLKAEKKGTSTVYSVK